MMVYEVSDEYIAQLVKLDGTMQAAAGGIYVLIGVIIACAIAIILGVWLRDI